MVNSFESEKNKKALLYTLLICGALAVLFILISWKTAPTPPVVIEDLIEINLGNNEDGWGEEQPLIKGEMGRAQTQVDAPQEQGQNEPATNQLITDNNPEEHAAPIEKVNTPITNKTAAPVPPKTVTRTPNNNNTNTVKAPVPQKPKLVYNGPGAGSGNNADQDNGYRSQGTTPGGRGDAGDPSGHPDSYGNNPGGKVGGPKVIKGTRKVIRYYSFTGDLPKATIYALVRVSPAGKGTFVGFDKGSTSRAQGYADAIAGYLRSMQFDTAPTENTVTVQFNFTVN